MARFLLLKKMVLLILCTLYSLRTIQHFHFHFSEEKAQESSLNTTKEQDEAERNKPRYAEASLKSPITNISIGRVSFSQENADSLITIKISIHGLAPNVTRALIIHELGSTKNGCSALGDHYNPFNKQHGAREDEERHVGDLGNVTSNSLGNVELEIKDDRVTLYSPYSVIGRGIVLHSRQDDHGKGDNPASKETGNVGGGIACGTIGHSEVSEDER